MKKTWPLFLNLCILIVGLIFFYFANVKQTNGRLAYPTDDTYIHMAVAKNFDVHGTWGGSKDEFSSLTSSPLWTLMTSVTYMVFGVNVWTPLLLNIIFGFALCYLIWYLLQKHSFRGPYLSFLFTLLCLLLMPIFPMIFLGMEHTAHAFLNIAFVYLASQYLSAKAPKKSLCILLLVTAPLLLSIRYEGLFVLGIVVFMLLLKRRYGFAVFLGLVGILPISLYGLYSISQGWYFFPNSVLLKGGRNAGFSISALNEYISLIVFRNQYLYVLILMLLVFLYVNYKKAKDIWSSTFIICTISLFTIFAHLFLASTGWFYRYEAYLVVTSIFAIAISICREITAKKAVDTGIDKYVRHILVLLISIFAIWPLAGRAKNASIKLPKAIKNIYEQQCQMGFFVKKYYDDQPIVLNDIGAVAYYSEADIFDSYGLMNLEIAKAKLNNDFSREYHFRLISESGAKLAILYRNSFKEGHIWPEKYVQVGKWTIPDNIICGSDTVYFYSLCSSETENLINNLRDFSPELPESIIEAGTYTNLTK